MVGLMAFGSRGVQGLWRCACISSSLHDARRIVAIPMMCLYTEHLCCSQPFLWELQKNGYFTSLKRMCHLAFSAATSEPNVSYMFFNMVPAWLKAPSLIPFSCSY